MVLLLAGAGRFTQPEPRGILRWAVTATSLGDADLSVSTSPKTFPRIAETAELGPLSFSGNQASPRMRVRARIPANVLPEEAFTSAGPVVHAQLHLGVAAETLRFPADGRLDIEVTFPDAISAVPGFDRVESIRCDNTVLQGRPVSFLVPPACEVGQPCELEFVVSFATVGFSEPLRDGRLDLGPSVTLAITYPLAAQAPETSGLRLDTSVRQ